MFILFIGYKKKMIASSRDYLSKIEIIYYIPRVYFKRGSKESKDYEYFMQECSHFYRSKINVT